MGLRINTNIAALTAYRNLNSADLQLTKSLERISTGLRINRAADDASGMIIADSLKAQSLGIGQAIRNASDGISIMQTADGALQESINIVNTIKTKAIQAASDGQTTETRKAIQGDINKLFSELDTIAKTTSFNGQKLLSGIFANKMFQIGANANEVANISIGSAEKGKIGHMKTGELHLATNHGGDIQLNLNSALTGETITLSSVKVAFDNTKEHSMGALADQVNRYSSITGINANAIVETQTSGAIKKGITGSDFAINGITIGAITVQENDSSNSLVSAVNNKTAETGVQASINSNGSLTLSSTDNRAIKVTGKISSVLGENSGTMSTLGYLQMTKKGASQFDLEGIGAGATGGAIHVSSDVTTVEESILTAGSTIAVGSLISAGSTIGGNAFIESTTGNIDLDMTIASGSSIQHSSTIAKGTVLGGSIIVSGNTEDAIAAANAITMVEQDMFLTAGTTLKKHSFLGKGTIITSNFTSGGVSFKIGDVLTSRLQLDNDLTLQSDMLLAYSADANHNSGLKAGSTIASGSETGAAFSIGFTWDDTSIAVSLIASAAGSTTSTADLYLEGGDVSVNGQFVIQEGSLLKDGTILAISSTGAWSGPTLITEAGIIEQGDAITTARLITLESDQVISEDFSTLSTTAAAQTIKAGSILTTGFQMQSAGAGLVSNDFLNANINKATLNSQMSLESGSLLQAGTNILSGSILGSSTYISGGLNSSGALINLKTTNLSIIKQGSTIETGSILAEGSTIGGSTTLQTNTNLTSEMELKAGTFLSYESVVKQGTTLNQDMDLYTTDSTTGATINVNYDANFLANAPAMAAFEYAISIWEGLLSSTVDITIDATYTDVGNNTNLGSAGPTAFVLGSAISGAAESGARYSMALANSIDGVDHNGATAEIDANFNSNAGVAWYFGTDGNPGGGEYDFTSVVMHELGHGLGFISLVQNDGSWNGGIPSIFDYFIEDAVTGDVFSDMSVAERLDAITSQTVPNQISWNGAFGVDAAGSNPILYSPDPWEPGSSVAHLDEATYAAGTANALMTPNLSNGEVAHAPGAIAMGMLQDMGWRQASGDLVSLKAGDVLTSDLKVGQNGITLSEDLILVKDSKVSVNSILAVNTSNSGRVNLERESLHKLSDLNVLTQKGAQMAIEIAGIALQDLDEIRSNLGSVQNQFVSTIANLSITAVNLKGSESTIRDVDFADETINFSRLNLLQQTASFALSSANSASENILALLQ